MNTIGTTTSRSFRDRPRAVRILTFVVAGVLALGIAAASAWVGYSAFIAPPLAKAQHARCVHEYNSKDAQLACATGDIRTAKKAESDYKAELRKKALIAQCADEYDDTAAQIDCVNGDTTQADADQKSADAAAAAAAKKATEGQTFDNPYPAGTQASMQSTNRLDGSESTYLEWITDFNANWTGYDSYEAPDTGMKYVAFVVHVQATSAGVDAGGTAYDASFTDANGSVYSHATAQYGATGQMPQVTLGNAQQASGIVVFEVPASVTGGVATFGDGTVFEALQ
ncbi:hypothetical protein ACX9R5_18700 [Rathayibacter sp. CAU 1779]